jgi:hypothetical protein
VSAGAPKNYATITDKEAIMIGYLQFHTNLDIANEFLPRKIGEHWDHIPPVGTLIDIELPIGGRQTFTLEVKTIRINVNEEGVPTLIRVELHIPTYDSRTILEWERGMKSRLGRL